MLPQLITAGVIGAMSPAAVLSAIMLLGSRRPVTNTVACLLGWTVVLIALSAGLLAILGDGTQASGRSAKSAVDIVVGVLLLTIALRVLLGDKHPLQDEKPPVPEVPAWMHRLETVKTWQALLFGMVLILVSPANLMAFMSAVQALLGSELGQRGLIFAALIAAIDSCILLPLGIYVLMPRRSGRILAQGKSWVVGHQRALSGWSAAVFGVVLLVDGIVSLP